MNEIKITSLLDTGATGIAFIDLAMARHVCDVLQISFIQLVKPKPIKRFDSKPAPPITHTIYSTLTVQGHIELLVPFLVTKLGQHPLILGKPWMQKHGVILDMSCDKLAFWLRHYQHLSSLPLVINTPIESHLSTSVHFSTSVTMLLTPHMDDTTTSATASAKPQKLKKSKKLKSHWPLKSYRPFQAYGQRTEALANLLTSRARNMLYQPNISSNQQQLPSQHRQ